MPELVGLYRILVDDDLNGCLEYDLKVFFHEDIRGLFTGKITWRQVCVWLRHLPGDSALVRRGAILTEWSRHEHFTISSIDMMKVQDYHSLVAAGAKEVPEPEMASRPEWVREAEFRPLVEMLRRAKGVRYGG